MSQTPQYVRVTYLTERIDDNTGTVKKVPGRVITGRVLQRRDGFITVQKDSGGTVMIQESNPVMAATMQIEFFDSPPG